MAVPSKCATAKKEADQSSKAAQTTVAEAPSQCGAARVVVPMDVMPPRRGRGARRVLRVPSAAVATVTPAQTRKGARFNGISSATSMAARAGVRVPPLTQARSLSCDAR